MDFRRTLRHAYIALFGMLPLAVHGQIPLTNGDFESGFSGWNNLTNNGAVADYSLEAVLPYAGTSSMKAVVTTLGTVNEWDTQSLGPTPALSTGETYTLSFYAKASAAGIQTKIVLQTNQWSAKTFTLTDSWQLYTWTFTAAEASPQLKIRHLEIGTTYFDNFRIEGLPTTHTLTLDPYTQHQTMAGIGGALTWYSNRVTSNDNRAAIENLIFDDLGLDIIRLKCWYLPDNYPANKDASNMSNYTDRVTYAANQVFYNAAKANGRDIEILYSSWSPPANLKESGSRKGAGVSPSLNTLKKDAQGNFMYDELAQYWVDVLDNISFTPDYLSFQNEPGYHADWETCLWGDPATDGYPSYAYASNLIHDRIKDRANVPIMVGPESENMDHFLNKAVDLQSHDYLGLYAYHSYNVYNASKIDDPNVISQLNSIRDNFGDKANWMTELSKAGHSWIDTARNMHNHFVEANASAYIYWKLVWESTNPDYMIAIDNDTDYSVGPHYYTIKHFSKFINEGYRRFNITGSNSAVRLSGFLDPEGKSMTVVAINSDTQSHDLDISHSSLPITSTVAYQTTAANLSTTPFQSLGSLDIDQTLSLPAESITTYVITLSNTVNPLDIARFKLMNTVHAGGSFTTSVTLQLGFQYSLWKSPDMSEGSWLEVIDAEQLTLNGVITFTDNSPASGRQFYRVKAE